MDNLIKATDMLTHMWASANEPPAGSQEDRKRYEGVTFAMRVYYYLNSDDRADSLTYWIRSHCLEFSGWQSSKSYNSQQMQMIVSLVLFQGLKL